MEVSVIRGTRWVCMSWDEARGTVSRAFADWAASDKRIKAFFKASLLFAERGFTDLLKTAGVGERFEADEHPQELVQKIVGIDPHEFEQSVFSAVLKDAVSAYEVYLEQGLDEVARFHELSLNSVTSTKSLPRHVQIKGFADWFGVDIKNSVVEDARTLRHLLTHRMVRAHTLEEWEKFGDTKESSFYAGIRLILRREQIEGYVDALAAAVRHADKYIWEYGYGGKRVDGLREVFSILGAKE